MREMIDKLSMGIIDYELPLVAVDTEKIEMDMMPGEQREGSFVVDNCGAGKLKGIIYSSSLHLRIKTKTFSGHNVTIRYVADTTCLKGNLEVQGEISIVSNGGERYIPFVIHVQKKNVKTSLGEMRNMFHFADLVQKDYDEALRLFCSARFPEIFLQDDYALRAKYEALVQGADKNIAMDEFLIASNKKKPVILRADKKEKYYENLMENYKDQVNLYRENWGYVKAFAETENVFVRVEKTELSSQDFNGNCCEIPYVICKDKLHEGYNYGYLRIRYLQEEIEIPIRVYQSHKNGERIRGGVHLQYEKYFTQLYKCYLDFRMHRIMRREWADTSLDLISKMRQISDEDLFIRLVQAQIMMSQGMEVETKLILEECGRLLEGRYNKDLETYCFYLYVKAIRERNDATTKKTLEKILGFYENGYDSWKVLWMLFYLDENYARNDSLRLLRIKEQYDRGMSSPLMYFESIAILNETPSLLRVLDAFERQVIHFGLRREFVSDKLLWRIFDLCSMEKNFSEYNFKLLQKLYEKTGDDIILSEMVKMLIKGAKTDKKYFVWYEKAVEKDFKLTGLYEYYMYAMSYDYEGPIPDVILMYFVYNLTLKGEKLDFLYKKVIEYRKESERIYHMYEKIIEKYVVEAVREGRVNDKLAVIYRELLPDMLFSADLSNKLPDILNTYMIVCNHPMIREVIVIHKEMKGEEHVPLLGGKAYVRIYAEDAAVVFGDVYGNRYIQSVGYQKKKLFQMDELLDRCYEVQPQNLGLLIYYNDAYFSYRKYKKCAIEVMEKLKKVADIRIEYQAFLEKEIIEYYALNNTEKDFMEYLANIRVEYLSLDSKIRIMELCILRGMYVRAYDLMAAYGCDYVNPALLFRCVDAMVEKNSDDFNETLLYFAVEAFRAGKYNERVLQFIGNHYYSSTKDMYRLWNTMKSFQCENREMEEKIVVQMLFTGEYGNHIARVFESYLENGASHKVKMAYYIRKSYDYFVRESVIEDKVFYHIGCELCHREDINYICELAWLKYKSEQAELSELEQKTASRLIQEMCKRNKYFEFYKKFQKYFSLPEEIENFTVLEYRARPDSEVVVHFLAEDGETYHTEHMRNVCQGIFIYPFILFYGENLKYYITETTKGETNVTESHELCISREHEWKDDTVYGTLNNMMVCNEMHEETTLAGLAEDYYVKKKLNQNIFMIR